MNDIFKRMSGLKNKKIKNIKGITENEGKTLK
jgi:hypothetical protein